MRKLLIFVFLLTPCLAHSEEVNLQKISYLESRHNSRAYNRKTKATGQFQITPICLKDYNQFHKVKYSTKDLFNPAISKKIAKWYFEVRIKQLLRKEPSLEEKLIAYNAGVYYVGRRLPPETSEYIKNYHFLKGV